MRRKGMTVRELVIAVAAMAAVAAVVFPFAGRAWRKRCERLGNRLLEAVQRRAGREGRRLAARARRVRWGW